MSKFKTKAEWVKWLKDNGKYTWADVVNATDFEPIDRIPALEVMDAIVDWEGGIASGFEIRCMINILYGMHISTHDIEW